MISHQLRQLRDLLGYSVMSGDKPLGKLTGLAFDPADWAIRAAVVDDPVTSRDLVQIPIGLFRALADERRELCFDYAGEAVLPAGGPGHSVPAEAAALLGRQVAGGGQVAGSIDDLIVNIDSWQLRYLVVRTGTGRVLTDIEWCSSLGEDGQCLSLDLPAAAVTGAPPFEGLDRLCIGHEEALYRHYTSRKYAGDSEVAQE
jgi:hypothetical protein